MINNCYLISGTKQISFTTKLEYTDRDSFFPYLDTKYCWIYFKITDIDKIDIYHSVYYCDVILSDNGKYRFFKSKTKPVNKFYLSEITKFDSCEFNSIWIGKEKNKLASYITNFLRIDTSESLYRIDEFEIIKENKVDMISLDSLFFFYNKVLVHNTATMLYNVLFKDNFKRNESTIVLNNGVLEF